MLMLKSSNAVKTDFSLHTATDKLNADEVIEKIKNGETLIFQAGPKMHVISVMFRMVGNDYLMFVANRGKERVSTYIKAYNIDQNLSKIQAEEILKLNTRLMGNWKNFIYLELPYILGFPTNNLKSRLPTLLDDLKGRDQQIGNCWQVSLKTLIRVMLICYACEKPDPTADLQTMESAVKDTLGPYKRFTEFMRLEMLKDYLKFRLEDHEKYAAEKAV